MWVESVKSNLNDLSKLLAIFVFALQFICSALAFPGFTNFGNEFSLLPPRCYRDIKERTITFNILTHAMKATVNVFSPAYSKNHSSFTRQINLTMNREVQLTLTGSKLYTPPESGIYGSLKIKSDSLIRVSLYVSCPIIGVYDFKRSWIEIIPKGSCSNTYYLTTWFGYPTAMVSSFGAKTTMKLHFKDRNYKSQKFSVNCNGDKPCASGKHISVQLEEYQTWFLTVPRLEVDLQNTIIRANQPVFVVTGNTKCMWLPALNDICYTHARPFSSWGREYVVPNFRKFDLKKTFSMSFWISYVDIRFNVEKLPFKYEVRMNSTSAKSAVLKSFFFFHRFQYIKPFVISSEKPFGVNLYIGPSMQQSREKTFYELQNLIPVEQWVNAIFDTADSGPKDKQSFTVSTVIISTVSEEDLTILSPTGTKPPEWISVVSKNRMYHYGYAEGKLRVIYSDKPGARVIIYKLSAKRKLGLGMHAVNFYQGSINNKACAKVKPVLSDGFDNDCDGYIDEETVNGKDDDGDGMTDEDTVMSPGANGTWTEWSVGCNNVCQGYTVTYRVRSCRREYFSFPCQGDAHTCEPVHDCAGARTCQGAGKGVACISPSDGCVRERPNGTTCDRCEDGYLTDDYCLGKCFTGWSGHNCQNGPTSRADFLAIFPFENSTANVTSVKNGKNGQSAKSHKRVSYDLLGFKRVLISLGIFTLVSLICIVACTVKKIKQNKITGKYAMEIFEKNESQEEESQEEASESSGSNSTDSDG